MMKKFGITGAEHKSIASQLLYHFGAMGRAVQATPEWRAAQEKAGWRDTKRAAGAKGRATQAKAGYPSLAKGRATQNAQTKAADLLKSPDALRKVMRKREYEKEYRRKRSGKLPEISAQEETKVPAHKEIDASQSPEP